MDMNKWEKFIKTGSVYDYLDYSTGSSDRDEFSEQPHTGDRNNTVSHVSKGLRQESNDSYKGTR